MSFEVDRFQINHLANPLLKVSCKVEAVGWVLIFTGFPLGNTTLGQGVLLLGVVLHLLSGKPFEWGLPRRDTFYLWGWLFLGASLISAAFSSHSGIAFATALGFFLLFFLVVRGSFLLVTPNSPVALERLVPWGIGIGFLGSLYAIYTYVVLGSDRAFGIAVGHNGLGGVSAFLATLTLGYMLQSKKYLWGGAAFLAILAALVLSFSRGSWLGFVFSILILAGLVGWRSRANRRTAIVFTVIIAMLTVTAFVTYPPLQARLLSAFSYEDNFDRILIWGAALNMIQAYPLTGVGAGVFPFVYEDFRLPDERLSVVSFAHNLPLQLFAEFGLIGFLAFLLFVGTAVKRGWDAAHRGDPLVKALYAAYLGMIAHEMVDNVAYGMNIGGLFWLVTGLLVHLHYRQSHQDGTSGTGSETLIG